MFKILMENTLAPERGVGQLRAHLFPRPHWPADWSLCMVPGGHVRKRPRRYLLAEYPGWICRRSWLSGWLRKWRYGCQALSCSLCGDTSQETAGLLSPEPPSDTGWLAQPTSSVIWETPDRCWKTPEMDAMANRHKPRAQGAKLWKSPVDLQLEGEGEMRATRPHWDRASEKDEEPQRKTEYLV